MTALDFDLMSTQESGGEHAATILDLAALEHALEVPIGVALSVCGSQGVVADVSPGSVVLMPSGSRFSERLTRTDLRVVHRFDSSADLKGTRRAMRALRRRGQLTCLAVDHRTPLPRLISQLHLGHDYVLLKWNEMPDLHFRIGLVKTAHEGGSEVIASTIVDRFQARWIHDRGVTLGIFS